MQIRLTIMKDGCLYEFVFNFAPLRHIRAQIIHGDLRQYFYAHCDLGTPFFAHFVFRISSFSSTSFQKPKLVYMVSESFRIYLLLLCFTKPSPTLRLILSWNHSVGLMYPQKSTVIDHPFLEFDAQNDRSSFHVL